MDKENLQALYAVTFQSEEKFSTATELAKMMKDMPEFLAQSTVEKFKENRTAFESVGYYGEEGFPTAVFSNFKYGDRPDLTLDCMYWPDKVQLRLGYDGWKPLEDNDYIDRLLKSAGECQ